jgi:hypothetical protein
MARSPRAKTHETVHRSVRIPLPPEGLRIAIVSDTHGEPHPKSLGLVARERPAAILHGGDIGALEVLDELAKIAPLHAVRGNIDSRDAGLADTIDVAFVRDGQACVTLLLTHIAVYGPRLRADVARLAQAHRAQLVVCGHSHVPFLGRDRGMVLFNPGSIGPRRPPLPITYGMMEIGESVSLRHMSCETGERWEP